MVGIRPPNVKLSDRFTRFDGLAPAVVDTAGVTRHDAGADVAPECGAGRTGTIGPPVH
ncbi:MAG: hypothetical protein S0880_19290 [Actinomycetota bacterium]|nr:hypothetical protein [Actinomycetota bacterium]